MDVTLYARRYLVAQSNVLNLVGSTNGGSPWVFRHKLALQVEGTSQCAILLQLGGSWASANLSNTARFVTLRVTVFSDPPRSLVSPGPTSEDAYVPAATLMDVVDRHLHRMDGGFYWDTLRVVNSKRLAEVTPLPVAEGDGLIALQSSYAITV